MAEVAITLKLNADEFQTLREELLAHQGNLRAMARDLPQPAKSKTQQREAKVTFILEKLG